MNVVSVKSLKIKSFDVSDAKAALEGKDLKSYKRANMAKNKERMVRN